jgi:hypothetical protein
MVEEFSLIFFNQNANLGKRKNSISGVAEIKGCQIVLRLKQQGF